MVYTKFIMSVMKKLLRNVLIIFLFVAAGTFAIWLSFYSPSPQTATVSSPEKSDSCTLGELERDSSCADQPRSAEPDSEQANDQADQDSLVGQYLNQFFSSLAVGGNNPAATSASSSSPATNPVATGDLPSGRYRTSVFNDTVDTTDITYKSTYYTEITGTPGDYHMGFDTGSPRDLKLNIYEPAGDTYLQERPLIIFVHGGGWTEGDRYQREPEAIDYAKRGYTTAGIDYTLLPVTSPPADEVGNYAYSEVIQEDSDDLIQAYSYLLANAEQYNIDTSRIGFAGWSAGGMNINIATHLNTGYAFSGLKATLASSSIFPEVLSGVFGGFRDFDESYSPVTKFASNIDDPGGSISFIDDCNYLQSIGHPCTYIQLDGYGHDLSFHLPPLQSTAIDFFATNIAGQ